MTPEHIALLVDNGYATLEKRCQNMTKVTKVTYRYLVPGPKIAKAQVSGGNPDLNKYMEEKTSTKMTDRFQSMVGRYVPDKVIMSILTSCDWNGDTLFSKLRTLRFSPITGRLYYPYNRMSASERRKIPNWDFETLDAKGSQLVILANEMEKSFPDNSFSKTILACDDVYTTLKPFVDEAGYKHWLSKMRFSTSSEEQDLTKKLDELFYDKEFDGAKLPRGAVKQMMYRIVFGGQSYLLKGFPELHRYVENLQGRYNHEVSMRYSMANRPGYHFVKNIASEMSTKEARIIHAIAAELSEMGIRYQIVHDGFDVEKERVAEAQIVANAYALKIGLKNYRFARK